jgi:streptogrisin C
VQWDGSGWNEVASSAGNTNEEQIEYAGVAGYYAWVVRAYSGSGAYSLEISRP